MTRVVLFFIALLGAFGLKATVVEGTAITYPGEQVRLEAYIDVFEQIAVEMNQAVIDSSGRFKFEFDPGQTRAISIRIKDYKSTFFVTPNGNYNIQIEAFDPKSAPPLSQNKYMNYTFKKQDEERVNEKISEINDVLARFQKKWYLAYLNNRVKTAIPELKDSLSSYTQHLNPFVAQYATYTLAQQELFAGLKKRDLFEKYLNQKNIQYQNPAFTQFFQDFYKNWFENYTSAQDKIWLVKSIALVNLDSLEGLLSRNDFLKNKEFAHRVMVNELYQEAAHRENFNHKKPTQMLKVLERSTPFPEVRQACRNYLNKIEKLSVGNPAPQFELEDQYGNRVSLGSLRGKYVYIDFFTTWCEPCIKSMVVMNRIYPQYKDSVEFVSISLDENEKKFNRFTQKFKYPWTFAWAGENSQLKSDYEIFGFPLYFLIDKEGKLLQSPAFAPGEGIEFTFKAMFEKKLGSKPEIWDWNQKPKGDNK